VALAACKPQTPAATDTPTTPAAATATPAATSTTPAPTGLAGSYAGLLPCADCEGIETTLELRADGHYQLTQLYQDKDHSSFVSEGSYTLESSGKTVHLHPSNKDEYDDYYAVLSASQLRMLDRDGKAIDSPLNYTLTRN
jgi:uncharacterized lipoprotein NlpE involved in copper resistance